MRAPGPYGQGVVMPDPTTLSPEGRTMRHTTSHNGSLSLARDLTQGDRRAADTRRRRLQADAAAATDSARRAHHRTIGALVANLVYGLRTFVTRATT
jgi:hypothetical protein